VTLVGLRDSMVKSWGCGGMGWWRDGMGCRCIRREIVGV
jgi:hypothetical protein